MNLPLKEKKKFLDPPNLNLTHYLKFRVGPFTFRLIFWLDISNLGCVCLEKYLAPNLACCHF